MALYRYLTRNEERKVIPLTELQNELSRVSQGKEDMKLMEALTGTDRNKDGYIGRKPSDKCNYPQIR